MEEVLNATRQYHFTTSTAEVLPPDDFVVEFMTEQFESDKISNKSIKINNLDELIDFLEQCEC